MRCAILCAVVLLALAAAADEFEYRGAKRRLELHVPEADGPLGVLVLLHGAGQKPSDLLADWAKVAARDGVICVAAEAADADDPWKQESADGIGFVKALVEHVSTRHAVDVKRIYLAGRSSGAALCLELALTHSDYFAGVVARGATCDRAAGTRRIPVALIAGVADRKVSVREVRELQRRLKASGWPVLLREVDGPAHTHTADHLREAWRFVRDHKPHYPGEMLARKLLREADAALAAGHRARAYRFYQRVLTGGFFKGEAQAGLTKIRSWFDGRLAAARRKAESDPEAAREALLALKKEVAGTPMTQEVDAALRALEKTGPSDDGKSASEAPSEVLRLAKERIERGERAAARSMLRRILKKNPGTPEALEAGRLLKEMRRK